LADVLGAGAREDAERLLLATRLAHAVARYDAAAAAVLEPSVRSLLGDARPAFPTLPDNHDPLGSQVQTFHLQIVAAIPWPNADVRHQVLAEALGISLARGHAFSSLYGLYEAWVAGGGTATSLTQLLLAALDDRRRPAPARLAARLAYDVLLGVGRSLALPAADQATLQDGSAKLSARLVAIAQDATEDATLRQSILSQIHRWAPAAVAELQGQGVMPAVPVPSRREHKDWSPEGKLRLSLQVRLGEVADLLSEGREPDLDRVITALRLAPTFASWLPTSADRLEPLVRQLIASRLPVPMKTKPTTLGAMALESWPLLFPCNDETAAWAEEAIREGLRLAVVAGHPVIAVADRVRSCCGTAERAAICTAWLDDVGNSKLSAAQRQAFVEMIELFGQGALAKKARTILGGNNTQ